MSRRRTNSVPSYRLHKQSGQAIVTLSDGLGGRRDVLLGAFGSSESRAEYARVVGEWEASGRSLPRCPTRGTPDLTVNEMLVRYWRFAEEHYRAPDGEPTSELDDIRKTLRPLRELYGHTPAKDFGPLALKAVRAHMIDAGYCRGVINQRVGRVKRCFKWAVGEELIPPSVLHGLLAVAGIQRGRTAARETEPVGPVEDARVEAVLPLVLPPVRAMIQL